MTVLLMVRPDEPIDAAMDAAQDLLGHLRRRIGPAPGDLVGIWRRDAVAEDLPSDPQAPIFVGRTMALSGRWALVWFDGPQIAGRPVAERRAAVLENIVLSEDGGYGPDVHPVVAADEGDPSEVAAKLKERFGPRIGYGLAAPRREAVSA